MKVGNSESTIDGADSIAEKVNLDPLISPLEPELLEWVNFKGTSVEP